MIASLGGILIQCIAPGR